MTFEKFYGQNNVFFGWRCMICGDILDPVILLHRLSQDANLAIPENEEEIMFLIKKYMSARSKELWALGGSESASRIRAQNRGFYEGRIGTRL
jgi:hypothetical protein